MKREKLMRKVLEGKPVELTEASDEVQHVREILEKEGTFILGDQEIDLGGCVYWDKGKSTAVVIWP